MPQKKPGSRQKKPQRKSPQSRPEEAPAGDGAEGSSGGSPRESEKGSPETDFVGDPGPAFEPGDEDQPEADLRALPQPEAEWDEEALSGLLRAKGQVLHNLAGVADRDWEYTEADLAAIAPPLARILNRYPVARAAAGGADPIALAIAASAYAVRSSRERSAVLAEIAEEEDEDVPVTGVPASPGSGPPPGHPAAVGPSPAPPAGPQPDPTQPEVDARQVEWTRP